MVPIIFRLLITVITLACASSLYAQPKLYSRLSVETVRYGEAFQVQFIVETGERVAAISPPVLRDFDLLEAYSSPAEEKNRYVYVCILSAKKTGKLRVPGAAAMIGSSYYRFPERYVDVIAPDAEWGHEVPDESFIRPGENPEDKLRKNFFAHAEISQKTVYVGEALMASYKVYSRLNAESKVLKRPSFTGFSVLEMVDDYNQAPSVALYDNRPFYMHLIRQVQLFALQPGNFQLDQAAVESVIHFRELIVSNPSQVGSANNGILRLPDSKSRLKTLPVTIESPKLNVRVLPLPQKAQPENFQGAVGDFTVSTSIDTGKESRLALTISGAGNFPLLTAPEINWPEGLIATAAGVQEDLKPEKFPLSGSKHFFWDLSAKDSGSYEIPAIEFSYFDPRQAAYKRISSSPLVYRVNGNKKSASVEHDTPGNENLPPTRYYLAGVVLVVIAGLLIYLGFGKNTARQPPVREQILPEAGPVLTIDPLFLFEGSSHSNEEFYRAGRNLLLQALEMHPDERVNSKQEALAKLATGIADETLKAEFSRLYDELEEISYGAQVDFVERTAYQSRIVDCYRRLVERKEKNRLLPETGDKP